MVPSPSCTYKSRRQPQDTTLLSPQQETHSSNNTKQCKKHHLAVVISSPARHRAAARHSARMFLQNQHVTASNALLLTIPNTRQPTSSNHVTTSKSIKSIVAALTQASEEQQSQIILPGPKQPSQYRCSIQQQQRACFDKPWFRRQAVHTNHVVSHKTPPSSPRNKRHTPQTTQSNAKNTTWPAELYPQQDTAPPLDTAHECH